MRTQRVKACRTRKGWRRVLAWGLLVALVGGGASWPRVAWAGGADRVRVELRSGEQVEGVLLDLGPRVYRVKVGDKVREIPEALVRQLVFLDVAVDKNALLTAEQVVPPGKALRWVERFQAKPVPLDRLHEDIQKRPDSASGRLATALLPGLKSMVSFRYRERGTLKVTACVYESAAAAERAAATVRRWYPSFYVDGQMVTPARAAVFRIRNVMGIELDYGVSAKAWAVYPAAVQNRAKKLEARFFWDRIETPSPLFTAAQLELPKIWLPPGVEAGVRDARIVPGSWKKVPLRPSKKDTVYSYRTPHGVVVLRFLEGLRPFPDLEGLRPFPDFAPELIQFRKAWYFGNRAVTLFVEGKVSREIEIWFELAIRQELQESDDGAPWKRIYVGPREAVRQAAWLWMRALLDGRVEEVRRRTRLPLAFGKRGGGKVVTLETLEGQSLAELLEAYASPYPPESAGSRLVCVFTTHQNPLELSHAPALAKALALPKGGTLVHLRWEHHPRPRIVEVYVAPNGMVAGLIDKSQESDLELQEEARYQLDRIQTAIYRYKHLAKAPPQRLRDLVKVPSSWKSDKRWNGPYLFTGPKSLLDPWGCPFFYRQTKDAYGVEWEIGTYGADGKPGGVGENEDLIIRGR